MFNIPLIFLKLYNFFFCCYLKLNNSETMRWIILKTTMISFHSFFLLIILRYFRLLFRRIRVQQILKFGGSGVATVYPGDLSMAGSSVKNLLLEPRRISRHVSLFPGANPVQTSSHRSPLWRIEISMGQIESC